MDIRQLRYFLAVAEAGHITRAGEKLGIQQPPLSQQIKALESELGFALLRRHPKGVSLTDAGQLFRAEAARLIADFSAMQERMSQLAEGKQGSLSVGFTSSAAAHAFTPETLRACRARFPKIDLLVSENNAADITEAVASSRLHCGFLRVPVSHPKGVILTTLLHEKAIVALPLDHRLARKTGAGAGTISLKDLHDENLILVRRPGAAGLYANLLALCASQRVVPKVVAEVERMMTNLNLVAAGVGLSVVPASMQGAHPHAITYRPLAPSIRLDAPLTLAYREADCAGATATFVEMVKTLAAAHRQQDGASA